MPKRSSTSSSAGDQRGAPQAAGGNRRRGRPKLFDRETVLNAALAMLDELGPDAFTLNALAKRLDAAVMTLYTYFPSREALLEAAAGHVFQTFEAPTVRTPWRPAIEEWLIALDRMLTRYPVGLKLIKLDGALSPSWLDVWLPLLDILSRAGLADQRLITSASWVGRVAMSMLSARQFAPGELDSLRAVLIRSGPTRADAALWLDRLAPSFTATSLENLYDFGCRQIVKSLEDLIEEGSH